MTPFELALLVILCVLSFFVGKHYYNIDGKQKKKKKKHFYNNLDQKNNIIQEVDEDQEENDGLINNNDIVRAQQQEIQQLKYQISELNKKQLKLNSENLYLKARISSLTTTSTPPRQPAIVRQVKEIISDQEFNSLINETHLHMRENEELDTEELNNEISEQISMQTVNAMIKNDFKK